MPKHKKHRKHVRKWHRGRPVKPKRVLRAVRGRPPVHPAEDQKLTMVRSTVNERASWDEAAAIESKILNLPPGSELTIGPWLRRVANERATLMFQSEDKPKTE